MAKKTEPWLQGQSIFSYVQDNIGKDGFFQSSTLPDRVSATTDSILSLELGAADAYLSSTEDVENNSLGESIYEALMSYSNTPTQENAVLLYMGVCGSPCIIYHESLVPLLESEKLTPALQDLALSWLYHAPQREAVKFAIVIAGLILLNPKNKKSAQKLKKDLLMLARCEEFTCYVLFALELSSTITSEEAWDMMLHTTGWGKICCMEDYEFNTPEEKEWLLCHGCELTVTYPGIALLVLKYGQLKDTLNRSELSHSMYSGILSTLHNYLLFLLNYENGAIADMEEEIPRVDLYGSINQLLHHATKYTTTLEDIAGLFNLAELLTAMAENEHWQQISSNQCHLLISETEKLIFKKNWLPIITAQLLRKDGSVNNLAVSLALALHLDIHTQLLKLLKEDPARTDLYYFLLQTDDKRRFHAVLKFAEKHLPQYATSKEALKPILTVLNNKPKEGSAFIIAGLTSIYDEIRAYALNVVESWPQVSITPEIKVALIKAKAMSQHPLLSFRIDLLLKKKTIDLDNFIEILDDIDMKE
jgi:hypothetical protein